MEMSDLPTDLVEEILSKLPVTCMRAVRSTCKKWNTLSKTPSFVEKHIGEETTSRECSVVMIMDDEISLMRVNLNGIHNKDDPFIEHIGKFIIMCYKNTNYSKLVDTIFHCDGLLLFVMNDRTKRIVVWNPYCGQHKWIQPMRFNPKWEIYAMGYEKKKDKSHRHRILRILDANIGPYEMYDIKSDSWKVLAINTPLEGDICFCGNALSLKGDAYWIATRSQGRLLEKKFLICFDFTKERLGPRLSLPYDSCFPNIVKLSSVREKQIALLFHKAGTSEMEIWVTSKITPNTVSWRHVWKNLVQGIMQNEFTTVWSELVEIVSKQWHSPIKTYLLRYTLQATVHTIWCERNAHRHGESSKDVACLTKIIDKNIRLKLLSIRRKKHFEDGLATWFGTRIDDR